jgi:hypothetical protein
MIFAVSTHSLLLVIDLDTKWRIRGCQPLESGYHYGLAIVEGKNRSKMGRDGVQVTAYRGGKSLSDQSEMQLMTYRVGSSASLVDSTPILGEMGDLHQITYANGGYYMANTRYNSLVYQSTENGIRHEYFVDDRCDDWNHINSIFPTGDQVFALLHNRARRESEIAVFHHDLSGGFELQRRLSLWDTGCHNIFCDGRYLFYNASAGRRFVIVDVEHERVVKRMSFGGYHTKGMSVTQDYIVIGLSEHTFRDRRSTSEGYLAVIDRHTLTPLAVIDLNLPMRHSVGNINEVRCLSSEELAHASSTPLDVNWSYKQLAKRNALRHGLYRIRTRVVRPARRAKVWLSRQASAR